MTDPWVRRVEIGPHVLYQGDCREILPTLGKVDALVTDPPYGLGDKWQGGGGSKRSSWRFDPREAMAWDREAPSIVSTFPKIAAEVIIWGGNYFALPPSRCWLVWDKKQNDSWTTAQCELAWTSLDRPVRAFRMAQCEQANEGRKDHPTQKPLGLMIWCLKWIAAQTILDPFMGSGTTGVACAREGRSFIGIELDPGYFDIACERIRKEMAQPRLDLPRPPEPTQEPFQFDGGQTA